MLVYEFTAQRAESALRMAPEKATLETSNRRGSKRAAKIYREEFHGSATGLAIDRAPNHRQGFLAVAAVGRCRILHLLYRPQQHLGRRADHEQGSRLQCLYLWLGRANFLLQPFPVRDFAQFDSGAPRRP